MLDAAYVHALGDLLQNVGVLVAAALIYFQPGDVGETDGINNWMYADPACTIMFSFLVVWSTKGPFMRAISTIMQQSVQAYEGKLSALRHVTDIHDLHVWSIGSGKLLSTAHLEIDASAHCTEVLKACISTAKSFGIYHNTFQLEVKGLFDHKSETFGGIHGHERCCAREHDQAQKENDNETEQRQPENGPGCGHSHDHAPGQGCCGRDFSKFSFHKFDGFCGGLGRNDSTIAVTVPPPKACVAFCDLKIAPAA